MNPLYEAAREVCGFMTARKWKFCIIGGLAVQRWGEPRTTLDVDLTLLTGLGEEESFIRPLLDAFSSRLPNAFEFALKNRVLALRAANGKDVDISCGGLLFEESMIRRAKVFEFEPGFAFPLCTAEDLFVMKAFASRPKDWVDAEGVAIRQQGRLNQRYILQHLAVLCELKESPEIVARARKVLKIK